MSSKPRLLRLVGIILITAAVVLGIYTLIAYLGWQSGQSLRAEQIEQRRTTEFSTQIGHAEADMGQGNHRLAIRRLEWVLEQDPDHTQAASLLAEAQGAMAETRAPSGAGPSESEPVSGGQATATAPFTTTTNSDERDPASEGLRQLERMVDNEEWDAALPAIVAYQNDFPDHERSVTDRLLYEAYTGQGIELLYSEQVELGLYYLDQAEKLGDLTADAQEHRVWAELYLDGMGYYGVDWDVTLFYFRDLCLAAPFFHNSCDKLFEALVAYGDQYAVQQEWCPAEALYAEAYDISGGSSLNQKLRDARTRCADATPTPTTPITDTVPMTPTPTDEP